MLLTFHDMIGDNNTRPNHSLYKRILLVFEFSTRRERIIADSHKSREQEKPIA